MDGANQEVEKVIATDEVKNESGVKASSHPSEAEERTEEVKYEEPQREREEADVPAVVSSEVKADGNGGPVQNDITAETAVTETVDFPLPVQRAPEEKTEESKKEENLVELEHGAESPLVATPEVLLCIIHFRNLLLPVC